MSANKFPCLVFHDVQDHAPAIVTAGKNCSAIQPCDQPVLSVEPCERSAHYQFYLPSLSLSEPKNAMLRTIAVKRSNVPTDAHEHFSSSALA